MTFKPCSKVVLLISRLEKQGVRILICINYFEHCSLELCSRFQERSYVLYITMLEENNKNNWFRYPLEEN